MKTIFVRLLNHIADFCAKNTEKYRKRQTVVSSAFSYSCDLVHCKLWISKMKFAMPEEIKGAVARQKRAVPHPRGR